MFDVKCMYVLCLICNLNMKELCKVKYTSLDFAFTSFFSFLKLLVA